MLGSKKSFIKNLGQLVTMVPPFTLVSAPIYAKISYLAFAQCHVKIFFRNNAYIHSLIYYTQLFYFNRIHFATEMLPCCYRFSSIQYLFQNIIQQVRKYINSYLYLFNLSYSDVITLSSKSLQEVQKPIKWYKYLFLCPSKRYPLQIIQQLKKISSKIPYLYYYSLIKILLYFDFISNMVIFINFLKLFQKQG
eukprot:TRINITY_DN2666_c0_g1_i5.p2 TRINITY_DN2666_c0_g1~~TRINITY_DN2666_c0_g1_i5.p2  ORF type:complete len:193 (-),score=-24.93 TRINITY_DN2666_c0_g1_i5:314-892(-)